MQPDRSNYKIWITAWLEGKLSESEVEQFLSFLEENHDILEENHDILEKAELMGFKRLSANPVSMPGKEKLERSAEEMTISQIEYLSVAFLENDITPGQLTDLEQNISVHHEHKEVFDTIQKTRLKPGPDRYVKKSLLKKHNTGQRILRYSAVVLSVAATVAILVLSVFFIPRYLSEKTRSITENTIPDTNINYIEIAIPEVLRETPEMNTASAGTSLPAVTAVSSPGPSRNDRVVDIPALDDTVSVVTIRSSQVLSPATTESLSVQIISTNIAENYSVQAISPVTTENLSAEVSSKHDYGIMKYSGDIQVLADEADDRSRLNRYFAGLLRGKILKDDIITDDPIKSYEVAQAGIEGLNRLLGWEMALVTTSNEKGELSSVYFSSGLLKVNVPVKTENDGL